MGFHPGAAAALRGLPSGGDVRITVTDNQPMRYLYNLEFSQEGSIPDSLHYTVTSDQLATLDTTFHFSAPGEYAYAHPLAFRPNDSFSVSPQYLAFDTASTSSAWDFPSSAPVRDQTPAGYYCASTAMFGSTDPCRAEPLIFLAYHAGVDPANSVTAPGTHLLQVTAFHQAPDAPPVTSLKLWISTDGGTTWQQLHVSGGHDGDLTAVYTVPALSQTNGTVSLRAQASDAAGNDVSQTSPTPSTSPRPPQPAPTHENRRAVGVKSGLRRPPPSRRGPAARPGRAWCESDSPRQPLRMNPTR